MQTAFPLAGIIKSDQPGTYLVIAENAAHATPDKAFSSIKSEEHESIDWCERYQTIPAHWVTVTDIALTAMTGADG